jgi:hypothetical protein
MVLDQEEHGMNYNLKEEILRKSEVLPYLEQSSLDLGDTLKIGCKAMV